MWLKEEDFKPVCSPAELQVLQQSSVENRHQAERTAIEEVASYLRGRYAVGYIFRDEANDRNEFLVTIVANVTLYYLSKHLPARMAQETRNELYERAIEWLKLVQKGAVQPNLPTHEDRAKAKGENLQDSTNGGFIYGSIPKQTHHW